MPYMVNGKGLYKKNSDGSQGELVKMCDSPEDAKAQMAAMMAKEKPMESAPLRTADLHELIDLSEAVLNTEARTAEVTLIRTGWSKNGRYYSEGVLAKAAPLWEGVKAYADHPSRSQQRDRPERSVLEAAGIYENVRHEGGATRATLRMIGPVGERLWPWIVEAAEGRAKAMGLSINALGQGRKGEIDGKAGVIVETIHHAHSVDIVTEPAAGGSFDRLLASDDGWTRAVLTALQIEELREARPDLIESLKREWKTTRDTQALAAVTAEREGLAQENQTLKAQLEESQRENARLHKTALVDRLLAGRTLPIEVSTKLRARLLEATDAAAMQAIVEDTTQMLAAVRRPVHVRGAGGASAPLPAASPTPPLNPLAEALGIDPRLAQAETIEEYVQLKESQGR